MTEQRVLYTLMVYKNLQQKLGVEGGKKFE